MTWQPTQAQIDRVLAKAGRDPEKLAIAYLRAQKRARDSEVAFGVMDGIAGASMGMACGDYEAALGELKGINRRMASRREINEKWGDT